MSHDTIRGRAAARHASPKRIRQDRTAARVADGRNDVQPKTKPAAGGSYPCSWCSERWSNPLFFGRPVRPCAPCAASWPWLLD